MQVLVQELVMEMDANRRVPILAPVTVMQILPVQVLVVVIVLVTLVPVLVVANAPELAVIVAVGRVIEIVKMAIVSDTV